jgi:hypothetical protein
MLSNKPDIATRAVPSERSQLRIEDQGAARQEANGRYQQAAVRRVPSVLTCGMMIFALKTALRLRGFGRVMGRIRRWAEPLSASAWVDAEQVQATERMVATAAAWYPGRARCLEQSLILYYLLRRQGVAAKYRHGVIPRPFQAHAWIEYQGQIINDVPEHARQFTCLPDLLP